MSGAECTCIEEVVVAEEAAQVVGQAQGLLRPHFPRTAAYHHAVDYLRGLLAEVERKNGWHRSTSSR